MPIPRARVSASPLCLLAILLLHSATASGATLGDPVVDGVWSGIPAGGTYPGTNSYHAAIYDPVGNQMVVTGGGNVAPGIVSALSLGSTPTWSLLSYSVAGVPTNAPAAIYDPVRKRLIQFAGSGTNDVWTLNLDGTPAAWTKLAPLGSLPAGREFPIAIYDPVRDRMVIFAGLGAGSALTDVWALSFASPPTWTRLTPGGTPPPSGLSQAGAYDPVGDRLVVYGGYAGGLWSLNLSGTPQWTPITTDPSYPAPPAHAFPAMIYDPVQARVVIFGGYTSQRMNDTWAVNLSGSPHWTALLPNGAPPAPTDVLTAIYQPVANRMIVYGGIEASAGVFALTWSGSAGPPTVTGFAPAGGVVGAGVDVQGYNLSNAQQVMFNGTAAQITSNTYSDVHVLVPAGATTGPISVTTAGGTGSSGASFFVGEVPVIAAADPASAKIGAVVILSGDHFTGATRVAFGPTSFTTFTVDTDHQITAVIDSQATTAHIAITTPAAVGTSAFTFVIVPPDTAPTLVSVLDVANDQGGHVYLKWARSDYDSQSKHWITGYRVWRRAPMSAAPEALVQASVAQTAAARSPVARVTAVPATFAAAPGHDWIKRVTPDGAGVEYWEALVTLPAAFLDGYSYDAPTVQDSMADSNPYTAFFVQGLTADPLVFYSSKVDSGYSVDNLAPSVPQSVAGSYGASGVALHWAANHESDLQLYRIYRGASEGFAPSPANLLAARPDTGYFDPSGDVTSFYKLAAVDVHGNQGRFALIASQFATSALASPVSAVAQPEKVDVAWYSADPGLAATLYRRTPGSDWASLGALSVAANGLLTYEDKSISTGSRYGYRLGIWDSGVEQFVGEAWVSVPFPVFLLRDVTPNPSTGRSVVVHFDLPSTEPATLRLFDVEGRLVSSQSVGGLGPGTHGVDVATGAGLSPGVYLIRLEQGRRVQTMRAVLMR